MISDTFIAPPATMPPSLLDQLLIGVIIVNEQGTITYSNEAACQLQHIPSTEVLGKSIYDPYWTKLDSNSIPYQDHQLPLAQVLQHGMKVVDQECGLLVGQKLRWVSVSAAPLFNEQHQLVGAMANFTDITDKKNTEKKLLQREQRLSSVANSQTSYLVRADLEGHFTYANEAFLHKYGYQEHEVIGQPFSIITDPGDVDRCIETANLCIQSSGKGQEVEIRAVNKQRDYFWTEWEFVGVADETGQVTEIQAVGRDISRKKRIEGLLYDTSQMAHVGGWELSSLNHQLSWTDETYHIHDLSPDTPVTLRTAIRFYHPDHQPIIKKAIKNLIGKGESFDLELKIITAQQREIWVRTLGQRETSHGNFIRIYGVIQDVTSIRQSEEKLKESEWLLKSVFNNTSDALFIINNNNHIIDCNRSALRTFEVEDKQALIGQTITVLQAEQFSLTKLAAIRKQIQDKGIWTSEIACVSSQGRSFWGDVAVTTFGEANYTVARVNDITERKQAEAKLLANNEKLKKANHELDRFVYSASHDLRAPLTSIIGLIELSKLENIPPTISEYLDLMNKSADKLDSFIQDLTHFSRNARTEVGKDPIDFEEMVHMLFEQNKFLDGSKQVVMHSDISQSADFYSDKHRLYVLFGNLISNAIKYNHNSAEESYVRVHIKANKKKATIRIEDNGMGIAQEHLDKIFDMFYRANDQKPGSGLGLYIVKETIEKLKGKITVTSELCKGSVFVMELPNLKPGK